MGNLCEKDKNSQSNMSSIDLKVVKPTSHQPTPEPQQPPVVQTPFKKKTVGIQDFALIGKPIGKGAFGTVYLVRKLDNNKTYAMKQIPKKLIIEHKLQENTILERDVLKQSKHPFIVQLKYSFQSSSKLFFVMEYVEGGEFYQILQQTRGLPENVVKFVSAEIVLALEYLNRSLKVIYRDLKPENLLLTKTGHVKLTDFGLATMKKEKDEKTYTLAGTPEYLAPEIITRVGHSFEVDLWTLGILIFEMINGYPPFTNDDRNVQKIQKQILENNVKYTNIMSPESKDLISRLLKTNPKERIGANGYQEIKTHPFYSQIKWDDLYTMKMKSPLTDFANNNAQRKKKVGTREEKIKASPVNNEIQKFEGITYNPDLLEDNQTITPKKYGES